MTSKEFRQIEWDEDVEDDCRQLIRLAVREDLGRLYDWTTVALVPESASGKAQVVARKAGTVAGLPAARIALDEYDPQIEFHPLAGDGDRVSAGQTLASLSGPGRSLLTAERPLLNLLGHLSGIATLTAAYVAAVAGTKARVYDTRKTTPGWRRLEKYAVRAGGGWNHRLGLFDAVLIKDNHLAWGATAGGGRYTPAEAVTKIREFLGRLGPDDPRSEMIVEVEVDTLAQLAEVLPAGPDIVLLDNLPPEKLREAVALRDASFPGILLEASGGIELATIAEVAASGVDRISTGALTHSAQWFDVGLDWI
ncbi:MAG TPA: carboxylating nicotinate-nucleotide diphosphorylase [Pirellulales bacterium]|jgi:nicotinate-nucleotide pyrophosphorylase (carboxylating)|nr:carboxylating nicotinate-nucleotide diphosphorylase [Pirellulales bacterium]